MAASKKQKKQSLEDDVQNDKALTNELTKNREDRTHAFLEVFSVDIIHKTMECLEDQDSQETIRRLSQTCSLLRKLYLRHGCSISDRGLVFLNKQLKSCGDDVQDKRFLRLRDVANRFQQQIELEAASRANQAEWKKYLNGLEQHTNSNSPNAKIAELLQNNIFSQVKYTSRRMVQSYNATDYKFTGKIGDLDMEGNLTHNCDGHRAEYVFVSFGSDFCLEGCWTDTSIDIPSLAGLRRQLDIPASIVSSSVLWGALIRTALFYAEQRDFIYIIFRIKKLKFMD